MTHYEIEQGLNALYKDLETAKGLDEETARRIYNVDSKSEIIEVIQEEIEVYEAILKPEVCEDSGMDYDILCSIQGLSRYA